MSVHGRVQKGLVVLEHPNAFPEETEVKVEAVSRHDRARAKQPRQGRMWKGQIHIAEDFDVLPDDIASAFGTSTS
jgi:hypothetical protein